MSPFTLEEYDAAIEKNLPEIVRRAVDQILWLHANDRPRLVFEMRARHLAGRDLYGGPYLDLAADDWEAQADQEIFDNLNYNTYQDEKERRIANLAERQPPRKITG
jgi:hypothetical protein